MDDGNMDDGNSSPVVEGEDEGEARRCDTVTMLDERGRHLARVAFLRASRGATQEEPSARTLFEGSRPSQRGERRGGWAVRGEHSNGHIPDHSLPMTPIDQSTPSLAAPSSPPAAANEARVWLVGVAPLNDDERSAARKRFLRTLAEERNLLPGDVEFARCSATTSHHQPPWATYLPPSDELRSEGEGASADEASVDDR